MTDSEIEATVSEFSAVTEEIISTILNRYDEFVELVIPTAVLLLESQFDYNRL
ncbi:hypothetical protein SAMN04487948_110100 [Halogranum amylolyticum]|uniref:Uncharacterized protein n=1 Tax=Halogranum amylolyticum TaxID=660520 RepID=A0A1H8UD05_9EURY|nr:hypothetical protein [Halogranum amylolyticum]SEP00733.1 hypothetical protein SAMN04487948_110100 [Halogranum amylolyticum]